MSDMQVQLEAPLDAYSLTPLRESDREAITRCMNEPGIALQLYRTPYPYQPQDFDIVLQEAMDSVVASPQGSIPLSVAIREARGEMVGMISFHTADDHQEHGRVGYWLSLEHGGKGVMTSALQAYIEALKAFKNQLKWRFLRGGAYGVSLLNSFRG